MTCFNKKKGEPRRKAQDTIKKTTMRMWHMTVCTTNQQEIMEKEPKKKAKESF